MKKLAILTVVFALFSFSFLAVSNADIVAENAKLQKLAGNFQFTEGPNPDRDGNVYFTDQPNDRIMLWHTDGRLTTFMQPCGRSNGLYFSKKGTILACADELNQLWSIDTHGHKTVILKDLDGKLFNGPNDLWERPDGGIYFTDPLYKRPYWKRNPDMQMDGQHVYFLFPDYKKLIRVADDLEQPNGIIGTADGKTLYIADIRARKTYSYSVNEDGTLSDKKLFCELGSDGMTIDQEGNVYLTGKGVTVFNKAGEQIKQIDVPENWTANVCFGGKDNNLLFITASKGVYGILMNVKGGQ